MHGVDVNLILHIIDGAIALVGLYFGQKNRVELKKSKEKIDQNAKDIDGVSEKIVVIDPKDGLVVGTERARDRLKREGGG